MKLPEFAIENGKPVDMTQLRHEVDSETYDKYRGVFTRTRHDVFIFLDSGYLIGRKRKEPFRHELMPIGGGVIRGKNLEESLQETVKKKTGLDIDYIEFTGDTVRLFSDKDEGWENGTDELSFPYIAQAKGRLDYDRTQFDYVVPVNEDNVKTLDTLLPPFVRSCFKKIFSGESFKKQRYLEFGNGRNNEAGREDDEDNKVNLSKLKFKDNGDSTYQDARNTLVRGCHDAYVETEGGILLVTREQAPAKGLLWPVGGGMKRGVPSYESLRAKVKEECGLDSERIEFLGTGLPAWQTNPTPPDGDGVGTHDPGACFYVKGAGKLELNHLLSKPTIVKPADYGNIRETLHPYVQEYMDDAIKLVGNGE